ncbi:MAG: hypothetical protein Q8Q42_03010 [Nanoarchaeota archaeon]|nr:hypothetical protein [Nanoarchaeota archaeon]
MAFFNFLKKVAVYGGFFLVGYAMHGCTNSDERYAVKRYNKDPFLVDKKIGERVEIFNENGKMQLGDLEYRLECLLENSNLRNCISSMKDKWRNK